eukprot:TRINITY_DN10225_c0_g1_i11.p1 TRINITY_DN10225_c0_g1~~TRINITY_DN10225_c0_g1_i11.p1  ORF type:complete len:418 (+),score=46.93 TRINITY_DN10225_c0_g1_i11:185-1255(+)
MDDTRTARDDSIATAFSSGEDSVKNLTQEYLDSLGQGTMEHVRSYLLNLKRITTHYCVSSGGLSKEVATSWEHVYSLRRDFYSTIRTYPSVTTVSYFAKGGAHIILWEVADTMLLDDDAYHHVQAFVSNGSAYDADAGGKPASKRTIWGEVEPDWTGDIHKWGTNFEPCDFEYRTHTRLNTSVPLKAPCGARSHADIVAYALAPVVPMHTTYFMGIATKVTHLMMQLACEFGSTATGETHGAVFLAMEMGSIQSFLQTLRFGTAEYGRIYIVVQSTQELVGTSSGLYVLLMCALCLLPFIPPLCCEHASYFSQWRSFVAPLCASRVLAAALLRAVGVVQNQEAAPARVAICYVRGL